jgi:hypothetical protein
MLAYHFISESFTTRFSNETTSVGHTLEATGKLRLRRNGLHASVHPYDALRYATSGQPVLCLVELSDRILAGKDKVCAKKRTILKAFDATKLLQDYAIWCAEQVLPIFEDMYPNEDRPRRAIDAAKVVIENPNEENKMAAYAAANAAVCAATYAPNAAATYAAHAAANAAVCAATYAANAADAARAARAAAIALPSLDVRAEFLRRVEGLCQT